MADTKLAGEIDVNEVASRVTAIYAPVVESLQQVRILARSFENGIATLEKLKDKDSAHEAGGNTSGLGVAIEHLRQVIEDAVLSVRASNTEQDLRQLQSLCHRLKNSGRELNALSSMMLVTAANAAAHGFVVDDLVAELRELSRNLSTESDNISTIASDVGDVRAKSAVSLRGAREIIDQHLLQSQGVQERVSQADLAQDDTGNGLQEIAQSLSRSISGVMPQIVACMQHPDAFSQRCDHVSQILTHLGEDLQDPQAMDALCALSAAQIDDMRMDLSIVQSDTCEALDAIASASVDTISVFKDHLRTDKRLERMASRGEALQTTRQSILQITHETDEANADLENCQTVFLEISNAFERLYAMQKAVRLSSFNADLSERQSTQNTPEMRSVTKAVGDCAKTCEETIAALKRSFDGLKQAFSGGERERLSAALERVSEYVDNASKELKAVEAHLADIRDAQQSCIDTLTDLVSNAKAASSQIASNALMLKQLEKIVLQLNATQAGAEIDAAKITPEVMRKIVESYTIEREREVHGRILGATDRPEMTRDQTGTDGDEADDNDPLASVLF